MLLKRCKTLGKGILVAKKRSQPFFMRKNRGAVSRHRGGLVLSFVVGFVMVAFYFWGRVQIDFVLRGNDRLEQRKRAFQRELDELRVQVNAMKSYQRIVDLAKKRGMVFVSASRLAELPVDMRGVETPLNMQEYELQYAGFNMIGLRQRRRQKPSKSEMEERVF